VQRQRGGNGLAIIVILALAVLVCGGGPLAYYLVSRDSPGTSRSQRGSGPATGPTTAASTPEPAPTTTAPTATGGSNSDVFSAKIGDCLANEGTDTAPKMHQAPCGPDTYEVLKRIPGTIDKDRCDGVPGYTHNYFYDSTVDDKDFVLCLKRR
jgi:hypothetical protein